MLSKKSVWAHCETPSSTLDPRTLSHLAGEQIYKGKKLSNIVKSEWLIKWTCAMVQWPYVIEIYMYNGYGWSFLSIYTTNLGISGRWNFFTSFYNWAKIQIISTHGHWLHFHTLASLPGHVLSRQSAWITLHCCKNVQKPCWAKLHTFARIIAFCFIITIIKISPTLFSLVGSEFDPNGCENQLYVNILITYSLWTIAFLLLTLPHCSAWMVAIFKWTMSP